MSLVRIQSVFLAVVFCFSALAAVETKITSVDTEGNITISKTKVLSVVQTRSGQIYNEATIAADCESIAKIDGVEYAYYNASEADGGVKITFVVVERSLIREVSIFGNRKLRDGYLRKQFNLRVGDYIDSLEIARATNEIKAAYAKKGYYFASVEFDKEALSEGKVIFRINEAKKVRIGGVKFSGNQLFTDSELKKVVKLRKRKFIFFRVHMKDEAIDEDIDRILQLYREKGHIDVECSAATEFNEKLDSVVVTFNITEGGQFYVGSIDYSGNEFFDTDTLSAKSRLSEGDVFNYRLAQYDRESVLNMYLESGFVDAQVMVNRKYTDNSNVDIEYSITEGDRFKIGRIEITGNQTTHDKVVRRQLDEVDFVPGNWYNAAVASGDGQGSLESDIKRAALADNVTITDIDSSEGQKTAIVNITEGRTGSVMFGAGVDSSNGIIGQVIFEQRNFDITNWPQSFSEFIRGQSFKGAGQRLRISLEPGTEVTRYSIDFTDPYAWDKPMELNVGSSKYDRVRESHDEERLRGYVGFTRRYKDGWALGLRFRGETVGIDPDTDAPVEVWDLDGDSSLFGFKLVAIKDNTDSRFLPTKGDSYEVSYEQLTGDFNFGIVTGIYRWYKTLTEDLARRKTVLATKFQVSSTVGDAPFFEKFYGGGTGNLRGFDYRGISPRGESASIPGRFKDPIGSDWIALANAEISVPLGSDTFNWLFFCDTGMIEDQKVRSSIGTGIEILIPQWFGPVPMRFELGVPITKEDQDDTRAFSFSMGRLF